MVDIPASTATTATIAVGGSASDSLEVASDHDWFRIQLAAGQSISVTLTGGTLVDPFLTIRNASGAILYTNDDGGPGLNALLAFSAPIAGTYFIDVGAAQATQSGSYQLSVAPYVPPPLGTIDQFADWLTSGFWNGDLHHFDVTQGGTISVNLTGLTADGRNVARAALDLWTDVIGVTFSEVSSGGTIVFDDVEDGTGAFSDGHWSNGITSDATVNVSLSRLGSGTGITRVGLQTYIHEIGHALGLGHAGDYNGGTAFSRYPYEATWLNDGAAISIMSYFDNGENSYYANQGVSNALVVTPQIADIAAAALLYGLSTSTRTGNTTYGFNNDSGRELFDAALHPNVAYTIFDSGGIDTLDYSGFASNQRINLNPETFSNVGSLIGNVSIARTVVIENAIGGSGNDVLIGNAADNVLTGGAGADQLTGGPGADVFRDTAGRLSGDTITDFGPGDRIVITDASLSGFLFNFSDSTLAYSGGTLSFGSALTGTVVASAAAGGGVQLQLRQHDPDNDFNGDGRSDVLWRADNGDVTNWLGQTDGSFIGNTVNAYSDVSVNWHIVGTGDFNGDHRDDVLWRSDGGIVTNWLGQANGGFAGNIVASHSDVGSTWQVAGTGDFNGDGRDDIVWRNSNGDVTNWLGQMDGSFAGNTANAYSDVSANWHAVGVGDFNGDAREDVLWRSDDGIVTNWLGQTNGGFIGNIVNSHSDVGASWQVAGTGDFNGDGRDDILWRNDNGDVTNWLGQADGSFAGNTANAYSDVSSSWRVAGVGDYNGDGRDDVLWRNDDGTITNWLGQPNGGFLGNLANADNDVGATWNVQPLQAALV